MKQSDTWPSGTGKADYMPQQSTTSQLHMSAKNMQLLCLNNLCETLQHWKLCDTHHQVFVAESCPQESHHLHQVLNIKWLCWTLWLHDTGTKNNSISIKIISHEWIRYCNTLRVKWHAPSNLEAPDTISYWLYITMSQKYLHKIRHAWLKMS